MSAACVDGRGMCGTIYSMLITVCILSSLLIVCWLSRTHWKETAKEYDATIDRLLVAMVKKDYRIIELEDLVMERMWTAKTGDN